MFSFLQWFTWVLEIWMDIPSRDANNKPPVNMLHCAEGGFVTSFLTGWKLLDNSGPIPYNDGIVQVFEFSV